jgi:hypothetical protein
MAESYHRSWRVWRSRLKVMGFASKPNPTPHQSGGTELQLGFAGQIKDGVKPSIITIRTNDFGALRATQSELKPFDDEVNRDVVAAG